jgi:hypothetical protein
MRCLPIPVGFMITLGIAISVCCFSIGLIMLARGILQHYLKHFPVFYSYTVYSLGGTAVLYSIYWFDKNFYPSAFWYYYLLGILVEFSVLIEISDHIFKPFPALRRLGRALTIIVSSLFAIFYVAPSIVHVTDRRAALLDFTIRASATKLVVILVLLLACRQLKIKLGKNIGGLMLGFALYHGVNVANYAAAKAFTPEIYGGVLWLMGPASYLLCLLIWIVALWDYVPEDFHVSVPVGNSRNIPLELTRMDNELSKFLER